MQADPKVRTSTIFFFFPPQSNCFLCPLMNLGPGNPHFTMTHFPLFPNLLPTPPATGEKPGKFLFPHKGRRGWRAALLPPNKGRDRKQKTLLLPKGPVGSIAVLFQIPSHILVHCWLNAITLPFQPSQDRFNGKKRNAIQIPDFQQHV